MRVSATTSDATRVPVTTSASWPNNAPTNPVTNIRGTKMTTVVSVLAAMADPTSAAPRAAARPGSAPSSRWRVTLSSTTMALSTTMPMATATASSDIVFSVYPPR